MPPCNAQCGGFRITAMSEEAGGNPGRTVLVVASEARELAGLLARCQPIRTLSLPVAFARAGRMNGMNIVAVANGAGFRLAAAAARVPVPADAVVSTGTCGALDPELAPGEVLVASSVNGNPCCAPETGQKFRSGPVVSQDRVAASAREKQQLRDGGAIAVEMEAGAVAEVAAERAVPFYCVRAVLDGCNEGFCLDFNRLRDREGRFSRSRIVAAAAANPVAGVPELLRLQRRGAECSRVLGRFLAECRF